jgi:uncharacterized membrane protein YadS
MADLRTNEKPGLATALVVLAIVVALAKIAHVLIPGVPGVVWALIFGVLAGHGARSAGRKNLELPYEVPLTAGFVMMGAEVTPGVFALVGWRGLLGVALLWAMVVGGFAVAARLRLLPARLAGLFALGLSGCGVSAVVTVAQRDRTIEGTPQTVATLVILLSGALALVSYPFIGDALGLDAATFGTFTGLTVANNAEAIATASTREDPSLMLGAAYKVVVNAFEGLAVLLYLWLFASRPQGAQGALKLGLPKIPGFVVGFAAVGIASLLGAFSEADRAALSGLTKWAFFIALVGVGFRTRLDQLGKAWKPTLVGLVLWAGTSALVLLWLIHIEGQNGT